MCKYPTVYLQELIYSFVPLQSTSEHKLAKPENRTYKDDLSVRLFVLFGLMLYMGAACLWSPGRLPGQPRTPGHPGSRSSPPVEVYINGQPHEIMETLDFPMSVLFLGLDYMRLHISNWLFEFASLHATFVDLIVRISTVR